MNKVYYFLCRIFWLIACAISVVCLLLPVYTISQLIFFIFFTGFIFASYFNRDWVKQKETSLIACCVVVPLMGYSHSLFGAEFLEYAMPVTGETGWEADYIHLQHLLGPLYLSGIDHLDTRLGFPFPWYQKYYDVRSGNFGYISFLLDVLFWSLLVRLTYVIERRYISDSGQSALTA